MSPLRTLVTQKLLVVRRVRLEAAGELDTVGDMQPRLPPSLDDSLIGRKLEVRWRYWRDAKV